MKYYRLRNQTKTQPDRRQADGSVVRFKRINACVGAKRRALQSTLVEAPGALRIRSGGVGGVEYSVPEVIHALLDDASEGIGARKTLGARRSEDATRRASQAVVHAARCCGQGGKRHRLKDGEAVQVFPRPSEHVMLFARRAASLLYYREIQKTAAAAEAI